MTHPKTTAVCALLAAAWLTGAAASQEQDPRCKTTFGYVDGAETVTIEVDGDDVQVLLNGAPMPEDRFTRSGQMVHCRDAHGRPVAVLCLYGSGGTLQMLARQPHRLRLGVTLNPPGEPLAEHLGLDPGETLAITAVAKDMAGDKAGLRKHDVITHIDGEPATKARLGKVLEQKSPGDSLELRLLRKGEPESATVVLEAETEAPWTYGWSPGAYQFDPLLPSQAPSIDVSPPVFSPYFTRSKSSADFSPFSTYLLHAAQYQRLGAYDKLLAPAGSDAGAGQADDAVGLRALERRLEALEKLLEEALGKIDQKLDGKHR